MAVGRRIHKCVPQRLYQNKLSEHGTKKIRRLGVEIKEVRRHGTGKTTLILDRGWE